MRKRRRNKKVVKHFKRKRDRYRRCPVCRGGRLVPMGLCARCKAEDEEIARRRGRRLVGQGAIQYGPYHEINLTRQGVRRQEV
jgi:hypothetical protein